MGTDIHFDKMLPAKDDGAGPGSRRQLEVLTPSGTNEIWLRLGRPDSQDDGDGAAVQMNRAAVVDLLGALESAVVRLGRFLK